MPAVHSAAEAVPLIYILSYHENEDFCCTHFAGGLYGIIVVGQAQRQMKNFHKRPIPGLIINERRFRKMLSLGRWKATKGFLVF